MVLLWKAGKSLGIRYEDGLRITCDASPAFVGNRGQFCIVHFCGKYR